MLFTLVKAWSQRTLEVDRRGHRWPEKETALTFLGSAPVPTNALLNLGRLAGIGVGRREPPRTGVPGDYGTAGDGLERREL